MHFSCNICYVQLRLIIYRCISLTIYRVINPECKLLKQYFFLNFSGQCLIVSCVCFRSCTSNFRFVKENVSQDFPTLYFDDFNLLYFGPLIKKKTGQSVVLGFDVVDIYLNSSENYQLCTYVKVFR